MTDNIAIAAALDRVKLQARLNGAQVINTDQISRPDRELLLATGWLQEIIRGWYILVRPDTATGDTAAWYANFWDFVRVYLQHRFGNEYCLAAESSMELHTANNRIPQQVIVIVKQGAGIQRLMYETSLLMYAESKDFPEEIVIKNGIRVMSLEYALCKIAPSYFKHNACDAEIALRAVNNPANLSKIIIKYNLKAAAARIIGAYVFLQENKIAESVRQDILLGGILVHPVNPFEHIKPLLMHHRIQSPYAGRIIAMWASMREVILPYVQKMPKHKLNPQAYLQRLDDMYEFDAYNSLSIEGYQVNDLLINRVKNSLWDPTNNQDDANMRNALAAKGYYDAFTAVKNSIAQTFNGESAAKIIQDNLQPWYQKLFYPAVQAGIINATDLMGFRNDRVFIRNSRHSAPPKEALLDAMEAFFNCLNNETNYGVSAILGHYIFVFIHPYMDGNGRIARFIMNTLFAAGGYPWTVIKVQNRKAYIDALEIAHTTGDIAPFTKFVLQEM